MAHFNLVPTAAERSRIVLTGVRDSAQENQLAVCACRLVDCDPSDSECVTEMQGLFLGKGGQEDVGGRAPVALCGSCRAPHPIVDMATAVRTGYVDPTTDTISLRVPSLPGRGARLPVAVPF